MKNEKAFLPNLQVEDEIALFKDAASQWLAGKSYVNFEIMEQDHMSTDYWGVVCCDIMETSPLCLQVVDLSLGLDDYNSPNNGYFNRNKVVLNYIWVSGNELASRTDVREVRNEWTKEEEEALVKLASHQMWRLLPPLVGRVAAVFGVVSS
ncbi:hypothetical protein C0J52_23896 [Blattella germanica]|nr:hypothetical protein C0J52_23896 [Blattella germanica]